MVKGIQDLELKGKRVLIRVDFNVPLDDAGNITDDTRIQAALPTIKYVLEQGGTPILMSHLGRPKGRVVESLRMAPVQKRIDELLGQHVELLENLRFRIGETKPEQEPEFASELAKLGDVYINDAFGTAHRAHTSTVKVAELFEEKGAGFLLQKEIEFLGKDHEHPFVAIIGGAKVSTKVGVLKALSKKVDRLLVGGAMAFTFLKAQGLPVGKSLVEDEFLETACEIEKLVELPVDYVCAAKCEAGTKLQTVDAKDGIPDKMMGLDVGPKTLEKWKQELQSVRTIFWNGPLGVFEIPDFSKGTFGLAKILADSSATTIIGGGDSVAAVNAVGLGGQMSHISTGGGASLEYIELGTLPGIEALK